jgi:two-component system, response regulator / RNA-binding antiterminator
VSGVPDPSPSTVPAGACAPRPLRVLLIDDGAHRVGQIQDELVQHGHEVVAVVSSALAVHDSVLALAPDVVIVDSESPSRDTLEHLAAMSSTSPRPVVVFSEDAAREPMQQALRAGVSAYVVAGLQPQRLLPVLQVAIARFAQDQALRQQLCEARDALSARKRVERAKGILMRSRGIDEDEAYRQLRRLAMDRGQRLEQVAEQVIAAADLLAPPG